MIQKDDIQYLENIMDETYQELKETYFGYKQESNSLLNAYMNKMKLNLQVLYGNRLIEKMEKDTKIFTKTIKKITIDLKNRGY